MLNNDQLANSATPVTVNIEVDSTSKPEKSMPHASSSKDRDKVATSTLAAKTPLIALVDFNFVFSRYDKIPGGELIKSLPTANGDS